MIEEFSHTEMQRELEQAASKIRLRENAELTETEMIRRAKEIAAACDWIWLEPTEIIAHRNWLNGKISYYELVTNTNAKGLNISVFFDSTTGIVFKCFYTQR